MRQIGLTGGIGSGKTTTAKAFEAMGYRVYYADDRAKLLYQEDQTLKAAIISLFGPEIYDEQGLLNRKLLSQYIFSDQNLLTKVNALVHPAVARDYEEWVANCPTDYGKNALLKEAAILFEARSNTQLDAVIMVYAPILTRLARVQTRDAVALEQVRARMASQWPDRQKIDRSDFIIFNDGVHALLPQIQKAIQWMETL